MGGWAAGRKKSESKMTITLIGPTQPLCVCEDFARAILHHVRCKRLRWDDVLDPAFHDVKLAIASVKDPEDREELLGLLRYFVRKLR